MTLATSSVDFYTEQILVTKFVGIWISGGYDVHQQITVLQTALVRRQTNLVGNTQYHRVGKPQLKK
jgi:hypothetical protein